MGVPKDFSTNEYLNFFPDCYIHGRSLFFTLETESTVGRYLYDGPGVNPNHVSDFLG